MRMLLPRFRYVKFPGGYVLSGRWFSYGYDMLRSQDYRLVQFGKKGKKANFICNMRATAKPPTFLYSSRWDHRFVSKTTIAGETTRPLDVSKMWRDNGVHN